MTFRLRDYQPADFDRLYELDQACFPPGISYSRAELTHYMNMRGTFTLIAETKARKPEIAGFIVGQRGPRGMGHIVTIDTAEKYRRAGLGTLLMNAVEQKLKASGCHVIILETAVDNAPAIAFYKRLGYFILKTIPRYYQNRTDAFLMAKRIAEKSGATVTKLTK
ncbi:MAG TPA: N-acetyltransferase [Terriglobales bacterium]|nr:N-acetyltransferase [Terriglobales bacterium]